MKTKKQTGMMPMPPKMIQGMGSMGGPMMRSPVTRPPMARPLAPALPTRRPPLMKMKGAPLAGFAPAPKKAKKKGKKGMKIPGLMI